MSYIGSKIGHIRIESRLGTGGMGEVYLGFDPRLERRVAVKTIRPEQRPSPQVKALPPRGPAPLEDRPPLHLPGP